MKVYHGQRGADGCRVTVNGEPLDPRLDLKNLSATGFEWGYEGGGPGQLALAILADHFGDDRKALAQYSAFRANVVSTFRDDKWSLSEHKIQSGLEGVVQVPMTLAELLDKVRWKG